MGTVAPIRRTEPRHLVFKIDVRDAVLDLIGAGAVQITHDDHRQMIVRKMRDPDRTAAFVTDDLSSFVVLDRPTQSVILRNSVIQRYRRPESVQTFRLEDPPTIECN